MPNTYTKKWKYDRDSHIVLHALYKYTLYHELVRSEYMSIVIMGMIMICIMQLGMFSIQVPT